MGLACLERLVDLKKNVVGVITADDALRDRISDWTPLDDFANGAGIPLYKVRNSRHQDAVELVRSLQPELVCVVSWSMIIPAEMLEIPIKGCVGFHYSMLPKRRGGAPLNWAIIDGLSETGITLFYLNEGIDSGDIVAQRPFDIGVQDTVKDLLDKIVILAPDLLAEHIDDLESGTATRIPQDESEATVTRRRRPEDGEIDWSKPDKEIFDFVRALAPPYPNAFTTCGARHLIFQSARLENGRLHLEGYLE